MRMAFKEWAVVVDALGRGEQILILRKGGISEGKGGFRLETLEFLFFPTLFHQQRESVLPASQTRYDQIAPEFPPAGTLKLEYWARVAAWKRLKTLEEALKLEGQHIWKQSVIEERFQWGREETIMAMAVRVHRLAAPVEMPMLPEYGGCKSWIDLAEEVPTAGSVPVLDEAGFSAKLILFQEIGGNAP